MKWYVATLIVECRVRGDRGARTLFDRQVRLLRAANNETAYRKAMALGKAENHHYRNSLGQKVTWKFLGLENLESLNGNRIKDGTEINSRLSRGDAKKNVCRDRTKLTVFWFERNKHKTARELLSDG